MQPHYITDVDRFIQPLAKTSNLLIIQDLDGVCMPLRKDPLTRTLDYDYLKATQRLGEQFCVLTNGEHIGRRGVNTLVERCCGDHPPIYLPGLAAGGVQLQDRHGDVSHPGVSDAELAFLTALPDQAIRWLTQRLKDLGIPAETANELADICVLDNPVSPSFNISSLHSRLSLEEFAQLQQACMDWLNHQLEIAERQGLTNSFFIHLAPNLGRNSQGERLMPANSERTGTNDLQFMLRGAIKESGVLVLLNLYFYRQYGVYPLGETFNARTAPSDLNELKNLAVDAFDPDLMPRIVGVGDTITSNPESNGAYSRGGSDRGFLTLVQALGQAFDTENLVALVDSSGSEIQRPSIQPQYLPHAPELALTGLSDADDPLRPNLLFCQGPAQYRQFLIDLATTRHQE